jgi:hypothetical protein
MWLYKSPIGVIRIVKNRTGSYSIVINEVFYGTYPSAVAAADDVYTFSTGCFEWDKHCADIDYQLAAGSFVRPESCRPLLLLVMQIFLLALRFGKTALPL